jgi:hypothetical protein
MAVLMLRTLPVMRRGFGKYEYRLIGSARPANQDRCQDDSEDYVDESDDTTTNDQNVCREGTYSVPPGTTPLPASGASFLSAVHKEIGKEIEKDRVAPKMRPANRRSDNVFAKRLRVSRV